VDGSAETDETMETKRVRTSAVHAHVGEVVTIHGWVHARRRMGKITFLVIRDGWGTVQVVADAAAVQPLEAARAGPESVVTVRGTVAAAPQAPGGVELHAPAIDVWVAIDRPRPVPFGRGLAHAALPTQLDHASVVLREPSRRGVLRLGARAVAGFRRALGELGFTEIFTPKIVGAATESGANVFALSYFGQPAYLAQSPQLYKQIMVGVFERVFEVGPVFRAEPHATVRHLAQYLSLDVELGFIADHHDVIAVLREVLAEMIASVTEVAAELGVQLPRVPAVLPAIAFSAARDKLAEAGEGPLQAPDLAPAEERWLGRWAQREHDSQWLVVTGYPMAKRPFYTHPDPSDPAASNSFDLLFRGTELVTGGQRLHRYEDVRSALRAAGISAEPFAGYLEAFAHGLPPHGGFAIGLERFVTQLCGLDNVRRATAFVRDARRSSP
jgi:nondiscriminating aspartyl-tRNA synthetase